PRRAGGDRHFVLRQAAAETDRPKRRTESPIIHAIHRARPGSTKAHGPLIGRSPAAHRRRWQALRYPRPMADSLKVAVLGAGAVGAYYGKRLADGGADVTLIARGRHLEALRE